jgi:hypothetical protein
MPETVVEIGDKLHIITRRKFESEVRRHFVGEITGISGDLCRLDGFTFVFNPGVNVYKKMKDLRTRIFSIGQDGFIVNKLPTEVNIHDVEYRTMEKNLVVTDGKLFNIEINEFGTSR